MIGQLLHSRGIMGSVIVHDNTHFPDDTLYVIFVSHVSEEYFWYCLFQNEFWMISLTAWFLLQCWCIQRMEIQDNMANEGMEFEGSATTAAVMNTSQLFSANITKITLSPYYQHSLYVASSYIIAYFFIFLLCIVGNTLVCLIVAENRRMRTVTNLFILNLAISDLLVGIFCIPTTLVDNLITGDHPVLNPPLCNNSFCQKCVALKSVPYSCLEDT